MPTPEMEKAIKHLEELDEAAKALSEAWDDLSEAERDVLGEAYPEGLPSFDEHAAAVSAWHNDVLGRA